MNSVVLMELYGCWMCFVWVVEGEGCIRLSREVCVLLLCLCVMMMFV